MLFSIFLKGKLNYAREMTHRNVKDYYLRDITEMKNLLEAIASVRRYLTVMNNVMKLGGFFVGQDILDIYSGDSFVHASTAF